KLVGMQSTTNDTPSCRDKGLANRKATLAGARSHSTTSSVPVAKARNRPSGEQPIGYTFSLGAGVLPSRSFPVLASQRHVVTVSLPMAAVITVWPSGLKNASGVEVFDFASHSNCLLSTSQQRRTWSRWQAATRFPSGDSATTGSKHE